MEATIWLCLAFITIFMIAFLVLLFKEYHHNKRKKIASVSETSLDLEKGFEINSLSSSSQEQDGEYSTIPACVRPLRPPRAVEKIGSITITDLTDEEKEEILIFKIRSVQDSLKLATSTSLNCNLIISVDATTKGMGGYCLNFRTRRCQMYSYKLAVMPWDIEDPLDLFEIGMKNLLFALMLWEDEIRRAKVLRIYVGSHEMESNGGDEDLRKVTKLMKHYQRCEKISLVNKDAICMEIKGNEAPDGSSIEEEYFANFVRFVQPAVDLANWRVKVAQKYLSSFYGIEDARFAKTHCQMKWNKTKCRPWYETTIAYSNFLEKVRVSRKRWETPCSSCGFLDNQLQ